MGLVEVVDDNEIEIGIGRHFAAAELAHGEDRSFGLSYRPVICSHRVRRRCGEARAPPYRRGREGLAGLLRGHRTSENARADEKDLLLSD